MRTGYAARPVPRADLNVMVGFDDKTKEIVVEVLERNTVVFTTTVPKDATLALSQLIAECTRRA